MQLADSFLAGRRPLCHDPSVRPDERAQEHSIVLVRCIQCHTVSRSRFQNRAVLTMHAMNQERYYPCTTYLLRRGGDK